MSSLENRNDIKIVVAAAPKTASTFFTRVLASLYDIPYGHLSNAQKGAEHELSRFRIETNKDISYVSQLHLRHSYSTNKLLRENGIRPVVLVRNIFDIMVSMKDYIRSQDFQRHLKRLDKAYSPLPMVYVDRTFAVQASDREMYEWFVDNLLGWYLSFYAGWSFTSHPFISYKSVVNHTEETLMELSKFWNIGVSKDKVKDAIRIANKDKKDIKISKGVSGRGKNVPEDLREVIRFRMKRYYPSVDFEFYLDDS